MKPTFLLATALLAGNYAKANENERLPNNVRGNGDSTRRKEVKLQWKTLEQKPDSQSNSSNEDKGKPDSNPANDANNANNGPPSGSHHGKGRGAHSKGRPADFNPPSKERKSVAPNESIGQQMKAAHSNGQSHPRFSIGTEISDREGELLVLDVIEAEPAVSTKTIIIQQDGTKTTLPNGKIFPLLVSDSSSAESSNKFALLAVDSETDEVHGIADYHGEKIYKVHQSKGKKAMSTEEKDVAAPPPFACDSLDDKSELSDFESGTIFEKAQTTPTITDKRRKLQSTRGYSYVVNLFIEIDNQFITNSGGTMESAANYINALVTAANVVYEREIDTHLNVKYIAQTDAYDSAPSAYSALAETMTSKYAGDEWHTQGVALHHALLGRTFPGSGGVAYVGGVCNPQEGFGLTSNIQGNFASLDHTVIWEMKAFMHELGHGFSSRHTHDTSGYNPPIDTCGTSCPATAGQEWSTIMSYCQACPGQWNNLMYTFGGIYDGSGDKSSITNWVDYQPLVDNYDSTHSSTDPRREAFQMYQHISTRGECVQPAACYDTQNTGGNSQNGPGIFIDGDGYGCDWYDENSWGCADDQYGNLEGPMGTPKQNCCACGGGSEDPPTSYDLPPNTPSTLPCEDDVVDSQEYRDWWGDGCEWYNTEVYENGADWWGCDRFGHIAGPMGTPNDHCCACGGGRAGPGGQTCQDTPDWKDDYDYFCTDFDEQLCQDAGNEVGPMGTANVNCCVCGGGQRCTDKQNAGQSYVDVDGKGCDWYNDISNVWACYKQGSSISGNFGTPNENCCGCGGGSN